VTSLTPNSATRRRSVRDIVSPTRRSLSRSPISTRYRGRIGTSLFDGEDTVKSPMMKSPTTSGNPNYLSPSRTPRVRKHSPISPTFQPLFPSPSRRGRVPPHSYSCDRYTPNRGDPNRYAMHSPTKRFVHNNRSNMMYRTNVFAATTKKKRKMGMNYSGTDDDPSSLNHRLKLKLSQHTYNQVLQSELLGFSAQHSNITNQVFNTNNANDDTQKNDNISSLQMDVDPNDSPTDDMISGREAVEEPMPSFYASPSLPNRRLRRKSKSGEQKKEDQSKGDQSHHPLCPCYQRESGRIDEPSLNSSESEPPPDTNSPADVEALCVCDSITSNVATNFLMSPQRTLRYQYDDDRESMQMQNQENVHFRGNMTMTPLTASSQCQLSGSKRTMRNIAKSPFKVLDAPRLTDDFYLNLVDWSSSCNILSVGLGECVYLWSAFTSKVTKLCDIRKFFLEQPGWLGEEPPQQESYDMVCSVGWSKNHQSALNNCISASSATQFGSPSQNGTKAPTSSDYLAVGSGSGHVFVYDTIKSKLIRSPLRKHHHRVGVIAWMDSNVLATGSRDRNIYLRDIRIPDREGDITKKLSFHKQEVCGLKWSEDSLYLASGGNDNKMAIWDIRSSRDPLCYGKHRAAVKAITWSPHDTGLIATGGGTADRCIKFWNINSFISSSKKEQCHVHSSTMGSVGRNGRPPTLLKPMEVIDTGSQVCNLLWSKNVNEIVSTHGYSLNQIVVWKFPSMDKIVTLTGHTYRVLYLAVSPDGQTVVTGAGDETLRLWNVFPPTNQDGNGTRNFVPKPYSIPLHIR